MYAQLNNEERMQNLQKENYKLLDKPVQYEPQDYVQATVKAMNYSNGAGKGITLFFDFIYLLKKATPEERQKFKEKAGEKNRIKSYAHAMDLIFQSESFKLANSVNSIPVKLEKKSEEFDDIPFKGFKMYHFSNKFDYLKTPTGTEVYRFK